MCGILGQIGDIADTDKFNSALNTLQHRGPDDWGLYQDELATLGHRRLSIIDLSTAAKQPMQAKSTKSVIVFNGEIYNYIELKRELESKGHEFYTESDTEVLLAAYDEWEQHCLKKLNGMWAFVVWSPAKKKLFFSRDRFGVKPFYYICTGNLFAFSSEPKALLALYPDYRRVDNTALYNFLALGNLYGHGRSFYEGVKVLPPAHFGVFDARTGSLSLQQYWKYPVHCVNHDLEQSAREFNDLFVDSVRLRLRSDVEVGITLSGGLDSTSILASANSINGPSIKCFTSTYDKEKVSELKWAELATRKAGNPLICAEARGEEWLETMEKIAWHMDGPGYSPAVYPLWKLMAQARSHNVPVMLEGQGADELLGGYDQYLVLQLFQMIRKMILHPNVDSGKNVVAVYENLMRTYPAVMVILRIAREAFPWLIPFYRKVKGSLGILKKDFINTTPGELSNAVFSGCEDKVNERLMYDHSYAILPGLLHYGDAISMAHSIESRNPYLDYRLVEWAFSTPSVIKLAYGQSKWLVRNYLRNVNYSEFGDRWDKKGYPTPVSAWLKAQDGAILKEVFEVGRACIGEYCDLKKLNQLINMFLKGDSRVENHIYRLVSTELWLRACVANRPFF